MRILFLSTWYPYPPDNGSKLRVYHLIRALTQRHQLILLSFAFGTARPFESNQLNEWCEEIQIVPINPYEMNHAGTLQTFVSSRPVATRPVPEMSRLVAEVLDTTEFDVLIASTETMADYILMGPDKAVKILEEHNSITRWMRDRYESADTPIARLRTWASWQKSIRYQSHFYKNFDLITMVSKSDEAYTREAMVGNNSRVTCIPNGVDCQHNTPDLVKVRDNSLVFNGSLTYSVNFDAMQWFVAEIFPLIIRENPEVTLTITGSLKGVDLAGLALDESVRLTDFVDDVRVPVSEAMICIVPIRQGSGTRLKILEAMALGTPVVTTSKGAEGLEVVNREHLLLADTPKAFATRTIELLNDITLSRYLATNARKLVVDRYDWEQIGRKFVDVVEETVEQ